MMVSNQYRPRFLRLLVPVALARAGLLRQQLQGPLPDEITINAFILKPILDPLHFKNRNADIDRIR